MSPKQNQYWNDALKPFVEKMIEKHYNVIEKLCADARKQSEKVLALEAHNSTSQYTTLCNTTIAETEQYIKTRKEKYVPYILSLSEKVETNHDCAGCTGSCKLNHDMQLLELKTSNDLMQNMLNKLQIASLPLHAETLYPEEYRLLRNQMALMEIELHELFSLENNYLIPKITEAQKNINASH